jgi:hypothetical protein
LSLSKYQALSIWFNKDGVYTFEVLKLFHPSSPEQPRLRASGISPITAEIRIANNKSFIFIRFE